MYDSSHCYEYCLSIIWRGSEWTPAYSRAFHRKCQLIETLCTPHLSGVKKHEFECRIAYQVNPFGLREANRNEIMTMTALATRRSQTGAAGLTPLEPHSRCGDKLLGFSVGSCFPVVKGLREGYNFRTRSLKVECKALHNNLAA